jgi:hypothetical protein
MAPDCLFQLWTGCTIFAEDQTETLPASSSRPRSPFLCLTSSEIDDLKSRIATDPHTREALREDPVRSRDILARIPAARWGSPEDIATTAVFLSSNAAKYIHGAIIHVDGEWLAR